MPRFEVSFPVQPPVGAVVQLSKNVLTKSFGGGVAALAAFNVLGYGLGVTLGSGETDPVSPPVIGAESPLAQITEANFETGDLQTVKAAAAQLKGCSVEQLDQMAQASPQVANSQLSTFFHTYIQPLLAEAAAWLAKLVTHVPAPSPNPAPAPSPTPTV